MPEAFSSNEGSAAAASIVICAYTEQRLVSVVEGVGASLKQLRSGDEIIVVIDHNPSLVGQVTESLSGSIAHGPVRVVANANARGLSGARNTGVGSANGEIVVFLDDDAVPQDGWLENLREPFADPEVIGVGGWVEPRWEAAAPDWFPDEFLWVVGCSYRGLPVTMTEIRNPIGANMAFRTDVVRRAGGFTDGIGRTESVPLGCEETEFSIRASKLYGGRILQQPAARVSHLIPVNRAQPQYFLRRCWSEGVSKAIVADIVGADKALDSERSYVTHTLPAGIVRAFRTEGVLHGLRNVSVIAAGLMTTALGYGRTRVALGISVRFSKTRPSARVS